MKDMEQKNLKSAELQEKDLEKVAGGAWGYHDYHNKDEYTSIGIKCNWTNNPFVKDKFEYGGISITSATASALVFYSHNRALTGYADTDIDAALRFKAARLDEYKADKAQSNG